jgi:hypothetical protein
MARQMRGLLTGVKRMADLIDRAALLKCLSKNSITGKITFADGKSIIETVEDFPSVDAVEVIRCRECQHWEAYELFPEVGACYRLVETRTGSEYCNRGERRTDADN